MCEATPCDRLQKKSKQTTIYLIYAQGRTYQRIILLGLLTRPDIGALDREENLSLVGDDLIHHDIVEDRTDYSANHLHGECNARGQVAVLRKFEILTQQRALNDRAIALILISALHKCIWEGTDRILT